MLARGIAASPGAAKGAIVFTADEAVKRGGDGEDVILVRPFTEAEDVAGFHAARGILTSEGGKASHAALVARGMGRPCVCGVSALEIDLAAKTVSVDGRELKAGDHIAIDGSEGTMTTDDVALIEPEISDEFQTVLEWSDELRRLRVRANADNPTDARKARAFGAEGIGLCRTEHMFFGSDRDSLVKEMFLAAEQWRRAHLTADGPDEGETDLEQVDEKFRASLAALGELQRADFEGIFKEMAGLAVTIRLLDPPLHEFLPVEHFEDGDPEDLALVKELREANPMLGTRGVRLAVLYPPVYEMQVKAIVEAAASAAEDGDDPHVEIMLPLIAYETELEKVRALVEGAVASAQETVGKEVALSIGTMLELPRACLVADRIAEHADFFSFGTNDLTQTAIGLSRDDVEGKFLGPLHRGRDPRPQPVRDDRRAGGGGAGARRDRARARREPRAEGRRVRRARRRSRRASRSSTRPGSTT